MTWLQPWAWLGAAAVILPIAIHLLGHGPARVIRFPSLRFVDPSRLLPTRRTRIHDPLLLLIRCLVLVAAAAAVAQPLFRRHPRGTNAGAIARVIVVDTSASMQRTTADGGTALAAARRVAAQLADSTPLHLMFETDRVGTAIAPAGDWVRQQDAPGTVVVITDAQAGSVDDADVAALSRDVGFQVVAVRPVPAAEPMQWRNATGNGVTSVTASDGEARDFAWQWSAEPPPVSHVSLVAGPAAAHDVAAAQEAAAALGARLPLDTAPAVTVVYPGADEPEMLRGVQPLADPAVVHLAARIAEDSVLLTAAWRDSSSLTDSGAPARWSLVATSRTGRAAVLAGESRQSGAPGLVLLVHAPPQSLLSVAALAAVNRARSTGAAAAEAQQRTIAPDILARWQRPPRRRTSLASAVAGEHDSDARWPWALALTLLLLESWLRRRPRGPQAV